MADIRPFAALRPAKGLEAAVATLPYDVMNTEEARAMALGNPHSFLQVSRSEISLPEGIDEHSTEVYQKAKSNFNSLIKSGTLVQDNSACFYLYELEMQGRKQTGLVACSSIDDYFGGIIKKHEFTRPEKEKDRILHMESLSAHVGPVFLTYRSSALSKQIFSNVKSGASEFDFVATDGIRHRAWIISDEMTITAIQNHFRNDIPFTYIADGHHRAASSAKVGKKLQETGKQGIEHLYFLTVLFPDDELAIMDYNRVVRDLNGHTTEDFISKVESCFTVEKLGIVSAESARPSGIHEFGMYLEGQWYRLTALKGCYTEDPIGILDVSILQDRILAPVLGVTDPRTDKRIDFVGGIRGLESLQQKVDSGEAAVAFCLYPVTIEQLMNIADSGNVMPPKSTWFEPKLRDGLFSHLF